MDVYAIICIVVLVIQTIWHATIGAIIFLNTPNNSVTPSMWFVHLDQYIFFTLVGIFIVMHIALIIWLYMVPLKHRNNMAKKDIDYQLSLSDKKKRKNNKAVGNNAEQAPLFSRISIEKKA
jgi:hypothetical protein